MSRKNKKPKDKTNARRKHLWNTAIFVKTMTEIIKNICEIFR